jgi:DNA-binding winged helix-turn-helix (wHTH) protein
VDVHVRRLRAKLGAEHEAMIGTVRNVGYKFVRPNETGHRLEQPAAPQPADAAEQAVRR